MLASSALWHFGLESLQRSLEVETAVEGKDKVISSSLSPCGEGETLR